MACTFEATPWELTARAGEASARISLRGDWVLVPESEGLDLRLDCALGLYGFGYRDGPAYTWTASVYVLLLNEYLL